MYPVFTIFINTCIPTTDFPVSFPHSFIEKLIFCYILVLFSMINEPLVHSMLWSLTPPPPRNQYMDQFWKRVVEVPITRCFFLCFFFIILSMIPLIFKSFVLVGPSSLRYLWKMKHFPWPYAVQCILNYIYPIWTLDVKSFAFHNFNYYNTWYMHVWIKKIFPRGGWEISKFARFFEVILLIVCKYKKFLTPFINYMNIPL